MHERVTWLSQSTSFCSKNRREGCAHAVWHGARVSILHGLNMAVPAVSSLLRCFLQRWTFPFVPDTNLLPLSGSQGVSNYTMSLSQLELTYRQALLQLAVLIVCHRVPTLTAERLAQLSCTVCGLGCGLAWHMHVGLMISLCLMCLLG